MTKLFDAKPFIIAEVGSNFHDYNDCKESIDMAAVCGADAVKFQAFSFRDLYGFTAHNMEESLPLEWLPKLAARCKGKGVEFMCTAFSPELVAALDPYVEVHKLASSDITDPLMLEAVKATRKPVILSTGGSSSGDIKLALNGHPELSWKGSGSQPVVLLYCNSAYPSYEHNLFMMDELKKLGRPVGFSDHSLDVIYAPLSAVKHFDAVVIEKHFKLKEMDTPDAPHSLGPDQFKRMVDAIRGKGQPGYLPTSEEAHMFLRNNRRLVATGDLPLGTVLKRGTNYGAFRSLENDTEGLLPFHWQLVEGKKLKVALKAGQGVSPKVVV